MKNKISYSILATILLFTFAFTNMMFQVSAQETLFWTGDAYSATGDIVTTPALISGTTYHIVVKSIFWYNYSGTLAADAQYYTTEDNSWDWDNNFPAPNNHSFLLLNGNDVNWGAFSNGDKNHTYSISYIGQGSPISFQVYDWVDQNISNNQCHISITIFEAQPGSSPTSSNAPTQTYNPTPTTNTPTSTTRPSQTNNPQTTPDPTISPTQTLTTTSTISPTPLSTPTNNANPTTTPTTSPTDLSQPPAGSDTKNTQTQILIPLGILLLVIILILVLIVKKRRK